MNCTWACLGTLCRRKSASTHSRDPEKTPTTSPRSPYHRKCPNNVSGDAQGVSGSPPRPPRSPVPPWRSPEAPPPLRKYKKKPMVFTDFQAAVRSAAQASKASPRPRWTSRSSTFTIHGGCGEVQGGGQRTLRASWEPKWRLGRPPMLCHRFQKH